MPRSSSAASGMTRRHWTTALDRASIRAAHDGTRPATREGIGGRRGEVYRWVFDANISAVETAARFGSEEILPLLLAHATPAQRLLPACAKADRATAQAIVASHPDLWRASARRRCG